MKGSRGIPLAKHKHASTPPQLLSHSRWKWQHPMACLRYEVVDRTQQAKKFTAKQRPGCEVGDHSTKHITRAGAPAEELQAAQAKAPPESRRKTNARLLGAKAPTKCGATHRQINRMRR